MGKIYNLLIGTISNFVGTLIIIPFILIPLLVIVLTIYSQIKVRKFKKNATIVKARVKEVKRIENSDKTLRGYDVTFEFEYNGELKNETIFSSKSFKVNSVKDGLYLEGKRSNSLSVEGEGFYVDKGSAFFGITFGIFVIYLVVCSILDVSEKIIIESVLLYLLILFSGLVIRYLILNKNKIFNKNNKKSKNDEIDAVFYDKAHYDEYSMVDSNLIRYIPEYKKPKESKKINIFDVMFTFIFAGLGGIATIIGISGLMFMLKTIITYDSTIAKISDIYTYETATKDGKKESIRAIYTYEVDGYEYTLDYETSGMYFKKVGDKEKLYYDKNEPSNSIPRFSLLLRVFVPLIIGLLFIYVGVQDVMKKNKKKRLYDAYVKLREEN